jgi:hypothetical protein
VTALLYWDRVFQRDRRASAGVSGKLINNALVMYDRQTRSLWSQFLSFSVRGEFERTPLEPVPLILTI